MTNDMNQPPDPYAETTPRGGGMGMRLLITIGGLVITVIGAIVLGVNLLNNYRSEGKTEKNTTEKRRSVSAPITSPDSPGGMTEPDGPPDNPDVNTGPSGEPEVRVGNLAGKYLDVARVPTKYNYVYYLGLYKNTGSADLRKPKLEIQFLDESGSVVNSRKYYSYGARGRIAPGESVPFRIRVADEPAHTSWRILHQPKAPYTKRTRLKLKITNARIGAPEKYRGHTVTGTITNEDSATASLIKLIAHVRCEDGSICGHNTWYLSRKTLSPGESAQFKFHVRNIKGQPTKLIMDYTGWAKSRSSSAGTPTPNKSPRKGGGAAWPE